MITKSALGILFLIMETFSNPTPKKLLADEVNYRLSTDVVPTKYTISLTFPEAAFTKDGTEFTGDITIDFRVEVSDLKEIKFHVADDYININKLTLNNLDLDPGRDDYAIDSVTNILTIHTDIIPLVKGNSYKMKIGYTGKISTTDNYGIYKSNYINSKNETVFLLVTQLEPIYARRVFPCFDEPAFKATFEVSVKYPNKNNLAVLFNTPIRTGPTLDDGMNLVSFVTTTTMSTYLVSLVVSDFSATEEVFAEGNKVSYKVWSKNELADSREYAKSIGPTILQKLNEYTGRSYGTDMSKLDQVAIPDFASEAMENWGLVAYREKLLLWNQAESSTTSKQDVATIIAHELAHQWFGNLITCDWWSETFLNEGFATFFEYFIPHQIESTWELDQQFVLNVVQKALEADSLETSQALRSNVSKPLEILDKFGITSYEKGGSIFRMVSHIMGEENFKAGIKDYIKSTELQFKTAVPSQLWPILEKHIKTEISNLPPQVTLSSAMENWVEKSGYPLLSVSLDGNNLTISQERFLLTGEDKSTKWYVPVTFAESESETKFGTTNPTHWLTLEDPEKTITLENNNTWVLLNPLETGFYRVQYDSSLLESIVTALNKEDFDGIIDLNRAHLIDDFFNLAKANKFQYSEVFKAIDFLKNDTSYYSWVPALKGFGYMMQRIPENSEIVTRLKDQILTLMKAFYESVKFSEVKEDDQIYSLKQELAISWACSLGEETCINNATEIFHTLKTEGIKPNKNLRTVVYCNALKNSDDDVSDYEFLWNLYSTSEDSTDKISILSSLGCSKDTNKLNELLSETIKSPEESKIKLQDSLTAFSTVFGGSSQGVDIALNFLVNNLEELFKKDTSMRAQKKLIIEIAEKLSTNAQIEKLRAITQLASFPSNLQEASEQALDEAQSNVNWISVHQKDLNEFYGIKDADDGANAIQINIFLLSVISLISFLRIFADRY